MSLRATGVLLRSGLLCLIALASMPRAVSAQACPADQFCFYVPPGLPLEASHSTPASRSFDIVLSSPVRAVTGSYSVAGGAPVPITISPGASQRIPLNGTDGPASNYRTAEQKGVFLVVDSPNLTVDHRETFDQEQYSETIKHSQIALGDRFRLGGYSLNREGKTLAGVDSVIVYAPTGGSVTLTAPPGATLPFWSGSATGTLTATLSAGQTYAVRTEVGRDVDGALLTATAPVAVSTGGRGWSQGACGDDGMDGLVPTSVLGREHVVRLPTGSSLTNVESRVRVIADVDGTEVRINGALVATLAAGAFHTFQPTALTYVLTSSPALVWMNGSLNGCELDTVLIPPIAFAPALTQLSLDFNVLASNQTPSGELAILIATTQVGSIRLDTAVPTFISSDPVPGRADLTYVRFNVTPGDHNVRAGADFQAMLASRTQPSGLLAYYNPYRIPGCGDSGVDPGEGCDDGDLDDGDGCSQTCTVEPGYVCTGVPSVCVTSCGNSLITAPSETCDDGNQVAGDGCNVTCRREVVIAAPLAGSTVRTSTPAVSGTADPGAQLTLTFGGVSAMLTADAQGAWSFTPTAALPDGVQMILVTATVARAGGSMGTRSVTIDTATTLVITAPTPNLVSMSATPALTGTGEPGAKVDLSIDGVPVGSTTVAADGSWTLTLTTPLSAGAKTLTGIATDAAGNTASAGPVSFTIDASTFITITTPAKGSVANSVPIAVTGTAVPGATVLLTLDVGAKASTVADSSGNWSTSFPGPLDNGPHSVVATTTDAAGNMATASSDFRIDTRSGPFLVIHNLPDGALTREPNPLLSGAADPGAGVILTFDGVTLGTVTATARGSWTLRLIDPLMPGAHTLRAETTDALGRTVTDQHTFTFDPSTTAVAITTPAEGSAVRTLPAVSGTASPGARVQVQIDGTPIGDVTAAGDGSWSLPVPATLTLADGHHAARATASDSSAHPGSVEVGFWIDTRTTVSIRLPAEGSTTGSATPIISGSGEPNAIVTVTLDGVPLGEVDVAADGSWSIAVKTPLVPGAHSVTASATDQLGNQAQDQQTFSYDPSAPADSDGDGRPDSEECNSSPCPDTDGDGVVDHLDPDDDGDGLATAIECSSAPCRDSDADGRPDYLDPDDDNDGRPTSEEHAPNGVPRDNDRDGIPDHLDVDDDGDGLSTKVECAAAPCPDSDTDGTPDWLDPDDDNDGVPTARERADSTTLHNDDADGDGRVNWLDPDANNNTVDDGTDGVGDDDGDGTPNYLDPDTRVPSTPGATLDPSAYGVVGGGGCSTTSSSGGALWLLALAALLQRRRRPSPTA